VKKRLKAPAELQNIDNQANNNVMHRDRLGEAYRPAAQPLDSVSKREVLPLYRLGMFLAYSVPTGIDVTLVAAPVVRAGHGYPQRFQKRF